jgi:hypothetical protein
MGELTEMMRQSDLQEKIEAGDLKIIHIGNLEFLATKQGIGFLEGCKKQAEMKAAWDVERRKNFGVGLGESEKCQKQFRKKPYKK